MSDETSAPDEQGRCTERSHERLWQEILDLRRGPTVRDIATWIGEILSEDLPDDAGPDINITEAATKIAAWLQPIGVFNGGGSICVLTDPHGWPYAELAITAYRRRIEAANERSHWHD